MPKGALEQFYFAQPKWRTLTNRLRVEPLTNTLSHRKNEQAGKSQHHLAVGTCRVGAPDLIGVVGDEPLAHRRAKWRKKRPQPRTLEPFDDTFVVLNEVVVLGGIGSC